MNILNKYHHHHHHHGISQILMYISYIFEWINIVFAKIKNSSNIYIPDSIQFHFISFFIPVHSRIKKNSGNHSQMFLVTKENIF